MKTLSLLRHAKSSWGVPDAKDYERGLNERGLRTAPRVGKWLKNQNIKPDLIICSPAVRTRLTCELVTQAASWNTAIEFDERVYLATTDTLLDVVRGVSDQHNNLLLIGHNPGMEDLLEYLTHEARRFPTAAFASVELNVKSWSETKATGARLQHFLLPRTHDE